VLPAYVFGFIAFCNGPDHAPEADFAFVRPDEDIGGVESGIPLEGGDDILAQVDGPGFWGHGNEVVDPADADDACDGVVGGLTLVVPFDVALEGEISVFYPDIDVESFEGAVVGQRLRDGHGNLGIGLSALRGIAHLDVFGDGAYAGYFFRRHFCLYLFVVAVHQASEGYHAIPDRYAYVCLVDRRVESQLGDHVILDVGICAHGELI